jgi:hypothetical protein
VKLEESSIFTRQAQFWGMLRVTKLAEFRQIPGIPGISNPWNSTDLIENIVT